MTSCSLPASASDIHVMPEGNGQHVQKEMVFFAQAYDQHLNMILGEVEETITTVEIDDETYEEIIKVRAAMPNDLDASKYAGEKYHVE